MYCYNPTIVNLFDSLSSRERAELRCMLDTGLTQEDASRILCGCLNETAKPISTSINGHAILFTPSALLDLECFGTGKVRADLDAILQKLHLPDLANRTVPLCGGNGTLFCDGPFRIVYIRSPDGPLVVAIAAAGISPLTSVWRYFDQSKAEDLLKTSELYFCRLDKLSGDPREGRLPHISTSVRRRVFTKVFGDTASLAVEEMEEILRATSYVCCWTRRPHESYLAWKHYCPSGGGFAIRTTWRQIDHLHLSLKRSGDEVFCRAVGYLDPFRDDLPSHHEGEQVFWKAYWFSDESEVRLAVFRFKSGNGLLKHKTEWPTGERITVDLNLLVHELVINPSASLSQKEALINDIRCYQPKLADRVSDSVIAKPDPA